MKTKVLTFLLAMLAGFVLHGQVWQMPYSENFEDGIDGWTLVDGNADGQEWEWDNYNSHTGGSCVVSYSYTGEEITPDNWLISPQVAIEGDDAQLSWWVAAVDDYFVNDYYTVYITTAAEATVDDFVTELFSETLTTVEWEQRTVDLSNYAGQTVRIAFRHYGCNGADATGIYLDDIALASSDWSAPTFPTYSITYVNNDNGYMYDYQSGNLVSGTQTVTVDSGAVLTVMMVTFSQNSESYGVDASVAELEHLYLDGQEVMLDGTNANLTIDASLLEEEGYGYIIYEYTFMADTNHILVAEYGPYGSDTVAAPEVRTFTVDNSQGGYVYYCLRDTATNDAIECARLMAGVWDIQYNEGQRLCIDFGDINPNKQKTIATGEGAQMLATLSVNGESVALDGSDETLSINDNWEAYGYRLYTVCNVWTEDVTFVVTYSPYQYTDEDTASATMVVVNNGNGYLRQYKDGTQTHIAGTQYYTLAEGETFVFTFGSFAPTQDWSNLVPDTAMRLLHLYVDGEDVDLNTPTDQFSIFNHSDQGYTFYNYTYTQDSAKHRLEFVFGPYEDTTTCLPSTMPYVSDLGEDYATVEWMPSPSADYYTVVIDGDSIDVADPSYTFYDLQPLTEYDVTVITHCVNGGQEYLAFDFTTLGPPAEFTFTTNGGYVYSYEWGSTLYAGTHTFYGNEGYFSQFWLETETAEYAQSIGTSIKARILEAIYIDGEAVALDGSDERVVVEDHSDQGYVGYILYVSYGEADSVRAVFTGDTIELPQVPITFKNLGGGYMYELATAMVYNTDSTTVDVDSGTVMTVQLATFALNPENYGVNASAAELEHLYFDGQEVALDGSDETLQIGNYLAENGIIIYEYSFVADAPHTLTAEYGPYGSDTVAAPEVRTFTVDNSQGGYVYYCLRDTATNDAIECARLMAGVWDIQYNEGQRLCIDFGDINPNKQKTIATGEGAQMLATLSVNGESVALDGSDETLSINDNWEAYGYRLYTVCNVWTEDVTFVVTYSPYQYTDEDTASATMVVVNNGNGYLRQYKDGTQTHIAGTQYYTLAEGETFVFTFGSFAPTQDWSNLVPDTAMRLLHLYVDGEDVDLNTPTDQFSIFNHSDQGYTFYNYTYTQDSAKHRLEFVFGPYEDTTTCLPSTMPYVSDLGEDYATVEWMPSPSADYYTVVIDGDSIDVADPSYTFYDLQPLTEYDVTVITHCVNGGQEYLAFDFTTLGPPAEFTFTTNGGYVYSYEWGSTLYAGTHTFYGNEGYFSQFWLETETAEYAQSIGTSIKARILEAIYIDGEAVALDGSDERVVVEDHSDQGYVGYILYVSYGEADSVRAVFTGDTIELPQVPITFKNLGGGYMYELATAMVYNTDSTTVDVDSGTVMTVQLATFALNPENYGVNASAAELEHLYFDGQEVALDGSDETLQIGNYLAENGIIIYEYSFVADAPHTLTAEYGPYEGDTTVVTPDTSYAITLVNDGGGYMVYNSSVLLSPDTTTMMLEAGTEVTIQLSTDSPASAYYDEDIAPQLNHLYFDGEEIDLSASNGNLTVYDIMSTTGYIIYEYTFTADAAHTLTAEFGPYTGESPETNDITLVNDGGGYMVYATSGSSTAWVADTTAFAAPSSATVQVQMATFASGSETYGVEASAAQLKHLYFDGQEVALDGSDSVLQIGDHLADNGYIVYLYTFTADAPHTLTAEYGLYEGDTTVVTPDTSYAITLVNDGGGYMVYNSSVLLSPDTTTMMLEAGTEVTIQLSTDSPASAYYDEDIAPQLNHLYFDGEEIDLSASNGNLTVYDIMSTTGYIIYEYTFTADAAHTLTAEFGPYTGESPETNDITLVNDGGGYMVYATSGSSTAWVADTTAFAAPSSATVQVQMATFASGSETYGVEASAAQLKHLYFDGQEVALDGSDSVLQIGNYLSDNGYIVYLYTFTADADHTLTAEYGLYEGDTTVVTPDSVFHNFSFYNMGNGVMMYGTEDSDEPTFVNYAKYDQIADGETVIVEFIDIQNPDAPEVQDLLAAMSEMGVNVTGYHLESIKLDGNTVPLVNSEQLWVLDSTVDEDMPGGVTLYLMIVPADADHYVEGHFTSGPTIDTSYAISLANHGNGMMEYDYDGMTGDRYVHDEEVNFSLQHNSALMLTFHHFQYTYPDGLADELAKSGATATHLDSIKVNGEVLPLDSEKLIVVDDANTYNGIEGRKRYMLFLIIDQAYSIEAFYSVDTTTYVKVDATSANDSMGYVTGGGYYAYGDPVELTAVAREGYRFAHWQDGSTEPTLSFVATADVQYVATFEVDPDGIDDVVLTAHITLYPNPAVGMVTIDGLEPHQQLTLIDQSGRIVEQMQATAEQMTLDVSRLPRGTYFVRVASGDRYAVSKLLLR